MRIWVKLRKIAGVIALSFMGFLTRVWPVCWKIGKKTFGFLLIGISASLFFLMIYGVNDWLGYSPDPYIFEISEFHGRILPKEQVHPGTFTVEVDFSEVRRWGEESIMSIGSFEDSRTIYLEVWQPIQKTPGVFNYAKKTMEAPYESRNFIFSYGIKEIKFLSDGKFAATRGIVFDSAIFIAMLYAIMALFLLFLFYNGLDLARTSS